MWYSHACCSAGSNNPSMFASLAAPGSGVEDVLNGVAGLCAHAAPLPRAMLGAPKPLRAFIGHVEPTFDWTLESETGQSLTDGLVNSIVEGLAGHNPVGFSFHELFASIASAYTQFDQETGL